jgi:hypothetical protein
MTPDFTREEKRREAEREVALRQNVYVRLVASGKLKPEKAERQINIMRAIALDYSDQMKMELSNDRQ